jgi:hypothetical protein
MNFIFLPLFPFGLLLGKRFSINAITLFLLKPQLLWIWVFNLINSFFVFVDSFGVILTSERASALKDKNE